MRFAFDLVLALATFFQENLRYVKEGQPVEVSLDLYPDQIFRGVVDRVWRANGIGQYWPATISKNSRRSRRASPRASTP